MVPKSVIIGLWRFRTRDYLLNPGFEIFLANCVSIRVCLVVVERALSDMPCEARFNMVAGKGGYSAHRVTRFFLSFDKDGWKNNKT